MMSKRNKEPHVKVEVDFYLINDVTFPQSRSVCVQDSETFCNWYLFFFLDLSFVIRV